MGNSAVAVGDVLAAGFLGPCFFHCGFRCFWARACDLTGLAISGSCVVGCSVRSATKSRSEGDRPAIMSLNLRG